MNFEIRDRAGAHIDPSHRRPLFSRLAIQSVATVELTTSLPSGRIMALYFFKPVVWNDQGYLRPGGSKFISGYPAEHGFGHEEWNNSDRLEFSDNGQRLRVFHTERFGNQPLSTHNGRIFVFMIASLKGKQYLVGVAGEATSLFDDKEKRHELADRLHLDNLWEDAWRLPSVRDLHGSESEFRHLWSDQYDWVPTWVCPADCYLSLKNPVVLDPQILTGKGRLITMYGGFSEIDRRVALRILDLIPSTEDADVLSRLTMLCGGNSDQDLLDDIEQIQEQTTLSATTRKALVDARRGQGKFRRDLEHLWDNACAVTGCSVRAVLRASHVKSWHSSSNVERLDLHNGLLLAAHLDALFDAGLITFNDDGSMLVSDRICQKDREELRLGNGLRKAPSDGLKEYLADHRRGLKR